MMLLRIRASTGTRNNKYKKASAIEVETNLVYSRNFQDLTSKITIITIVGDRVRGIMKDWKT